MSSTCIWKLEPQEQRTWLVSKSKWKLGDRGHRLERNEQRLSVLRVLPEEMMKYKTRRVPSNWGITVRNLWIENEMMLCPMLMLVLTLRVAYILQSERTWLKAICIRLNHVKLPSVNHYNIKTAISYGWTLNLCSESD